MIWETTISYHDMVDGKEKTKRVKYVIDHQEAFGEVESILHNNFEHLSDFEVFAIKKSKAKEIANVRHYEDERIYEATLRDVFITEDGDEKPINYKILLFAKDFDKAKDFISEYIKQGYDLTLVTLKETSFVDILV